MLFPLYSSDRARHYQIGASVAFVLGTQMIFNLRREQSTKDGTVFTLADWLLLVKVLPLGQ